MHSCSRPVVVFFLVLSLVWGLSPSAVLTRGHIVRPLTTGEDNLEQVNATDCTQGVDHLKGALKRRDTSAFASAARHLTAARCSEQLVVNFLQTDVDEDLNNISHFLNDIFPAEYFDEDADTGIAAATPDGSNRALLSPRSGDGPEQRSQQLMFVHIPKNGGSAVVRAGAAAGEVWGGKAFQTANSPLSWFGRLQPGRPMPDGHLCSWPHVPPNFFLEDNPYKGDVFCVTRDPYERVVSDYRYQAQWAGKWWTQMYWWFGLHRNGMDASKLCTADGLNSFVQTTGRLYVSGHKYLNDCHTLPQSAYIFKEDGGKWCDHILPLGAHFVESFNNLMKEYGSSARLQNTTRANVGYMCPQLTTADLSLSSRSLIEEIYSEDFERLGFERQD